jgi:hypothetical protein
MDVMWGLAGDAWSLAKKTPPNNSSHQNTSTLTGQAVPDDISLCSIHTFEF